MRSAFVTALTDWAERDPRVLLIVGDNGAIVFDDFRARFPDRFINVGISEQQMVGFSAGAALSGYRPVLYTIIPFLTLRALEQIRVDLCMQQLPVILAGIGAGVAYSTLGPTHHGIEDIACMRSLPNMTVVVPSCPDAIISIFPQLEQVNGPVYLRLGTSREPNLPKQQQFKLGHGTVLRKGKDAVLFSCGRCSVDSLSIATNLAELGISLQIIDINTIQPLDTKLVSNSLQHFKHVFTLEEHSVIGGLGSAIAEVIAETPNTAVSFKRFGLPNQYTSLAGTRETLLQEYGLLPEQLAQTIATQLRAPNQ